ncbi:MAG: hypothetical protein COB20_09020 [SAR86 cluster bacterium]|uniref:Uncharacterized protein n=1 Tax=SAR86 cluster bacterium TaxID=2030880 RepID=A0A2A4X3H1_9GAMM|nr:MAG: hypothetical protein COB20_09020 [SAR86 cluster bacterium]
MATAAETTSIIQLVVGMVNAAPGADILAELEAIVDSGVTIEELAEAITENPAWSGDTGLFPDFLPNAIFADSFLTQLLGGEVTEEVLTASIDAMTADLNAGTSRGAAINASIDALAASTDPDFADAAAALANKTEVAEYYSVTIAQSSESLDELVAVVSDVDSSDTAVADGTAAADDVAASLVPLVSNLNDLAEAQVALAAYLLAEGQDPATEAADPATTTAALLGLAGVALGDVEASIGFAGYATASPAVQASQLAAEEAVLQDAVDTIQDTLDDLNDDIDAVTGLGAASAALTAANLAVLTTGAALALDDIALQAAEDSYNLLATAAKDIDEVVMTGGFVTSVEDAADDNLIETTTAGALKLTFGVTETTHPGITAMLAAYVANNAAQKASDTAGTDASDKLLSAQLLDVGAAADATRSIVGALTTGAVDADFPTQAEITAHEAGLITAEENGRAALIADITAVTHTGVAGGDVAAIAAVDALLDAAVIAEFISAGDQVTIQGLFDAELAGDSALLLPAAKSAASDAVDAALEASNAAGDLALYQVAIGNYVGLEVGDNPLIDALDVLVDPVTGTLTVAQAAVDDLAELVEAQNTVGATYLAAKALEAAVTAATAVLTAEDVVVATVADDLTATEDNDVYLLGTAGGDIDDFGAEGDDAIFIGTETYVINTGDVDDDGDDTVLEIFISESVGGDTTISVETSVFGSNAAVPEVIEVVLTGVAAADVVLADSGLLSVA